MFNFLVILGEANNTHIHSSCRPRTHTESPLLCSHKLDMTNIKSQRNFILTRAWTNQRTGSSVSWTRTPRGCYMSCLRWLCPSRPPPIQLTNRRTNWVGFTDGSDGKESAWNVGDPVRSLRQEDPLEKGMATPVFLPGEFHRQRSLVGYSLWTCKESDTTERLTLSLLAQD